LPVKALVSAYIALTPTDGSSLAFNLTRQSHRDGPCLDLMGLGYNQSLGRYGYLQGSLIYTQGQQEGVISELMYTLPLGARSNASIALQHHASSSQATAELQQSPPVGSGVGYRVLASMPAPDHSEGDLYVNSDHAAYEIDIAKTGVSTAYRASISGGLAMLGGDLYLSRQVTDSFGVLQVSGMSGVRVYDENQLVAKTNSSGNAFIPNLRSYQANHISIEQADLPLNVEVKQTDIIASPYANSGMLLRMPVALANSSTYALRRKDGSPVPAGSEVRIEGETESYPVGLGGVVYIPTLQHGSTLRAAWPSGACTVSKRAVQAPDHATEKVLECD
jgi:outer membrane usher protein